MKDSRGENETTDCIVTIEAETIIDRRVCKYFIKESLHLQLSSSMV